MNDCAEKNYLIKRPLFMLGVILFMSSYGSGFSPFLWKVLCLIGLCASGPQIVMFFRNRAEFDRRKNHPAHAYPRLFLLGVVLADVLVFLELVYFPFSPDSEVFFRVFFALGLALTVKILFFPGKADDKKLTLLRGLLIVSFTVYLLYGAFSHPFGAMILPFLFLYSAWKLVGKTKGTLSHRQAVALCLSTFLFGEYLTAEICPCDPCGQEDVMEETLSRMKRKAGKKEKLPPIFTAIRDGDKETVEKLAKTDANAVDDNVSALIEAVWKEDPEMVDILIKAGADVNFNLDKHPAIRVAILEGKVEIARMLADAGADLTPRHGVSLWVLTWFSGMYQRVDFRMFSLLREKNAPFFIEGTPLSDRLFFPFGLFRRDQK